MVASAEESFAFQTNWLRAYASAWSPCEAGFSYAPAMLRREGVSVVDLRNLFRDGVVTYDNKLDEPGALWIVEGTDDDGTYLVAEIIVVSETMQVTVRRVKRTRIKGVE